MKEDKSTKSDYDKKIRRTSITSHSELLLDVEKIRYSVSCLVSKTGERRKKVQKRNIYCIYA